MWFIDNWANILTVVVLASLISLVCVKLYRDKRKGVCACGNSCAGCPKSGHCKEEANVSLRKPS